MYSSIFFRNKEETINPIYLEYGLNFQALMLFSMSFCKLRNPFVKHMTKRPKNIQNFEAMDNCNNRVKSFKVYVDIH